MQTPSWRSIALLGALLLPACSEKQTQAIANLQRELEIAKEQRTADQQEILRLQTEVAEAKKAAPAPETSSRSASGTPTAMSSDQLLRNLQQFLSEQSDLLKESLAKDGREVVEISVPAKIAIPTAVEYPYRTEVKLRTMLQGREEVWPIALQAGWDGKWLPPSPEALQAAKGGGTSAPAGGSGFLRGNPPAQPVPIVGSFPANPPPGAPRPVAAPPGAPPAPSLPPGVRPAAIIRDNQFK